ncbi:unnamed protein product [Plutella xylostella]|uniref:(diamondback moth) hypothetical protein n=1 Tax=Plutella xylostella TaxID=51655 RepID=A0A8S4F4N9_PLUXY|nr:unnamed protein product [Plutella xylostella]
MRRIRCKWLVLLMTLCVLLPSVMTRIGRMNRQKDPLTKARCDLICVQVVPEDRSRCRSDCYIGVQKPGTCPAADSAGWAAACVAACDKDSQCDGTKRCCRHECGASCQEPSDLTTVPGLPGLPIMGEIQEKRRSAVLTWSDGVGDLARAVPGKVLYIVEEQHHLGPKYEEERLENWNFVLRSNKTRVSIRDLLKPGRWYRFRVAAVSAEGTRGYSAPSAPFTPRRPPRPPLQPRKLRVVPVDGESQNGTMTIRLMWEEPRSDLPVLRYKVFWSRRLRGVQSQLDSVVVNHQTVAKTQTYYDIKDLEPNSMYFLQVQTISQYGLTKLRSEKAAIFFNTTNVNEHITKKKKPHALKKKANKKHKKIKGLKLNRIIWQSNHIMANLTWTPSRARENGTPRRYYVRWQKEACTNKEIKEPQPFTATTKNATIEIDDLEYNCSYRVSINKSPITKSQRKFDAELVFKVPDCKTFQRKVSGPNTVNCQS